VTGDRSRQVLTLTAATAQVLLPTLWGPRFAQDEHPPDVIQPAPYTFAVWLPIFASSLGYAGLQARGTGRDSELARAVGWPLAGAFASTAVWAPLVRTGKYWSAQAALASIAAFAETARRRVARAQPIPAERAVTAATTLTTGMLAAWGLTATGVNLASMLAGKGLIPEGGRRAGAAAGLLLGLGAAGAAATSSTAATPVGKVYAATLIWGLTGVIAGQRTQSPIAAIAAGAAVVPIAFAATRQFSPDTTRSA
jgi:hypothetical protein